MNQARPTVLPEVLLLVDDHYLRRKQGLTRTFNSPEKHPDGPLLHTGQASWDTIPLIFGSVRRDAHRGLFSMWYTACLPPLPGKNVHERTVLALARSRDGVHWTRPRLDVMRGPDRPQQRTNLLFGSTREERYIEPGGIIIDPEAPPHRRYLLAYCAIRAPSGGRPAERRYRLAWSADGVHWRRGDTVPYTPPGRVDRHTLLRHPHTGEYLLYLRGEQPFREKVSTVDRAERTVCFQRSSDLKQWSPTRLVMAPDSSYAPGTNIYSLSPFFRGGTLLGVYQIHDLREERETVTTHLCWSHNLVDWVRRKDEFIPLGVPGEWDRFNQAVADQPVITGDGITFYYSGRAHRHHGYKAPKPDAGSPFGGISTATLGLDRFASLSASFDGGVFTTRPFLRPADASLFLNADCRWGRIEVEVTRRPGEPPVAQTALEHVEGVRLPVDLPGWTPDEPMQLTCRLFNARVYALYGAAVA